jgi:hypothetical protein
MRIIGANISHPVGCHLWRVVAINQLATCNRVGPKSIMATTRLRRVTALAPAMAPHRLVPSLVMTFAKRNRFDHVRLRESCTVFGIARREFPLSLSALWVRASPFRLRIRQKLWQPG